MKSRYYFILQIIFALLYLCPPKAMAQDAKTVYAISDREDYGKGIYTFELGDKSISNLTQIQSMTFESVSGGLLVDNYYYYLEYRQTYNGYETIGLYAYDMESKATKQIADYGSTSQGTIACCFSYDYQQNIMYGLDSFNGGSSLVKIDLDNGVISTVGKLKLDILCEDAKKEGASEDHLHVMTSTYDGIFYGVSYWGALYKINQYTAECQYIGTLDYNPGQAFMYTGDCLFYDNDTEQLYLRFTTYDWSTSTWLYEIVKIDKNTAKVTRFADVPANSTLNAISVPFTVAEASAPAKVNELVVNRGARGDLSATLEWDNPVKTYGRGGTLEDLDYVLIFRNDILVDSLTNQTIGGHCTWTDNSITERGYYTYRLVTGNDMGRGDRASVATYIGKGDPMPVENLKAVRNGDGVSLSWTAPTEGRLDSYIDVSTLNYDIVRFKNSETTGETIAKGIKDTEYEDNTLSEMARYTYMVTPHTDNAIGDSVKTDAEVFGPAITIPHTFTFDSYDEFLQWTTIDANMNYTTWQWSDGTYGSTKGASCSYYYDGLAAADWLISPRMKFEAGKHYKMTFDATPGNGKIIETLAILFGKGNDIAVQDSVDQFDIASSTTVRLRTNLPVVETTDEYNFGFYYRSYMQPNYSLTISNVEISEDHDGYVSGIVTSGNKPVEGATVIANGGEFTATTDKDGKYELKYLPEGEYPITVKALGYEDASQTVIVTEYETTNCDINITPLPTYTVTGKVADVAGDPVAEAAVTLSGYDNKETKTAADGTFIFKNVYKNDNYSVTITKNKLLNGQKNFSVEADTELGTITLKDNIKPAGKVSVTEDGQTAEVTWKAPANDAVLQRIDDGTLTTSVGIENSTSNTMFGVVKREPSAVSGVEFYIDGTSSVTHYSVQLNIFDLDENGEPTDKLLYQNTYVPVTDGQWNTYTLPAPVDAPNGYYIALSSYNYLLVGIDGAGDAERWPFVENVNCFTPDYTQGVYYYLEGQTSTKYHHNFLIRPVAAPYHVAEDDTEFTGKTQRFIFEENTNVPKVELESKDYGDDLPTFNNKNAVMKTPQSRIRYNVYRMKEADMNDESKWAMLAKEQQARSFSDTNWGGLEQGVYVYAVKAVYTGGDMSEAVTSDIVGNKMHTKLTFNITTDTPENEAYGAKVTLTSEDGERTYNGYANDNGIVEIDKVWKTSYDMTISLDGFNGTSEKIDVSSNDAYTFNYSLTENRIKPYNLIIEDTEIGNSKLFIWNYPNYFTEDFEGHDDFAINSPGTLGWQYIDGDGCETGAVSSVTWPGQFSPMAYMVFNQKATTPAMDTYYILPTPRSGDKMLTDWAAYGKANDDWLITPKLYFNEDFTFSFYAASSDYSNMESIEVGYSMTTPEPSSFIMVQDSTDVPSYWTNYTYTIPAGAKYVAIHCISDTKRILSIDDIEYGLPTAFETPTYIRASRQCKAPLKSPSIDGLYEVYLDGEKVTQQDGTQYTFTNLSAGRHTAGVIASYTSGKTEMSTIDFDITADGIAHVTNEQAITIDGDRLSIEGGCDKLEMYGINGTRQNVNRSISGSYNIGNVAPGVYMIRITKDSKINTVKITIK